MTRVAIVTDSSADLGPEDVAGKITVVPVAISRGAAAARGGKHALAGDDVWTPAGDDAPRPRPEMVEAFTTAFATLVSTCDAVVAVLLSDRLGDSVAAAAAAQERVSGTVPVTVVDSRSVTLGLGFQALHAAAMARGGADAATIVAELESSRERFHVVFSVESAEHLHQSGQIGRSAALIAGVLQLKPLLRLDEGQMVPYERVRTQTRAIAELADFVRELPMIARCAVLYSSSSTDARRLLRAIAADTELPPDRLTMHQVGNVVADHVGPGALGIAVEETGSG